MPELDDAFAADVSEFETMDELRGDVRARLEAAAEAGAQREFRAAAVDKAVAERHRRACRSAMIEREAHRLYHELEENVGERGLTMDVYLGVLEKTAEEVEEELQPQAEHIIKRRLVLEAIAAAEELEVSDDEMLELRQGRRRGARARPAAAHRRSARVGQARGGPRRNATGQDGRSRRRRRPSPVEMTEADEAAAEDAADAADADETRADEAGELRGRRLSVSRRE